jgi:hypothetical protein
MHREWKPDYQSCFDSLRFPAIDAQIHTLAHGKKEALAIMALGF